MVLGNKRWNENKRSVLDCEIYYVKYFIIRTYEQSYLYYFNDAYSSKKSKKLL